jgi:hypothetical protein
VKRLLIIVLGPLERDFRVRKQIQTLKRTYAITVAPFSPPPVEGVEYVALKMNSGRGSLRWLAAKRPGGVPQLSFKVASFLPSLATLTRHDLVLCNDANTLQLGLWAKRRWDSRGVGQKLQALP